MFRVGQTVMCVDNSNRGTLFIDLDVGKTYVITDVATQAEEAPTGWLKLSTTKFLRPPELFRSCTPLDLINIRLSNV